MDARARYTRHIILDTFLDLLKEKPLEKITVKEICQRAEINRSTFYKHYTDVNDLMEQLKQEALKSFEQMLLSTTEIGTTAVLTNLLQFLSQNKNLMKQLTENTPSDAFMLQLADCCSKYALSDIVSNHLNFMADPQKQCVYSYVVGGTSSLIDHWLKTDTKESPEVLAAMIEDLNNFVLSR